jgi:hypothetical protein
MTIIVEQTINDTSIEINQEVIVTEITVAELGEIGHGLPAGGTTGQVPGKASDNDYDIVWVDQTGGVGGGISDATTTVKGKLKLAGDLGGTADLPTVPALANKVDKVTGSRLITSAESVLLGNTSGVNSGDNATNSQYSGLASSKYDASNPSGYQTAGQVQTIADAKVANTITNGVTTSAPNQDTVFDALALKAPLASPTFTGTVRIPSTGVPSILSIGTSGDISPLSPTSYPSPNEIAHVKGVTNAIQTQLNNKQPLATVLTNTTASFTTEDETKLDKYPTTATNGKMLQGNGTNYVEVDAPSSGVAPQTGQIIVTSGTTFTVPAGLGITASTVFNIELVGAGGGGAGALNTTAGAKGSAGGGGGYVFKRLTGLTPGNYVCVIGTAGVGSALGVNGNAGTATTLTILGVTYTANGGGGGLTGGTLAGGVGGTAINGDLNYSGQNGGDSLTAGISAPSAKGGDTAKGWGLGGASVRNAIAGSTATGNGGGGSGGHASAGGNGSGGIIFCQWFNQ